MFNHLVICGDEDSYNKKDEVKKSLMRRYFSYKIEDLKSHTSNDYSSMLNRVSEMVSYLKNTYPNSKVFGLVFCGSNIGKIVHKRENDINYGLCYNKEIASLSRKYNDTEIVVLDTMRLTVSEIKDIISIFINTKYEG